MPQAQAAPRQRRGAARILLTDIETVLSQAIGFCHQDQMKFSPSAMDMTSAILSRSN
jgi:hypothetical protein